MNANITGFAAYLPRLRLSRKAIAQAWGRCGAAIEKKTVLGFDEDTLTMANDVARQALTRAPLGGERLALVLASTTPVYAERLSAGSLGMMLGLPQNLLATEHTSSARAGTEALITIQAFLAAGMADEGLLIAADAPVAAPHDPLDHGFGAAAAALVFGRGEGVASLGGHYSYVADYPGERFRVRGQREVEDIGVAPYSGQALAEVLGGAARGLLRASGRSPGDFRHVVAVQPDPKSVVRLLGRLGFSPQQLAVNAWQSQVGDVGAAAPLLGLVQALTQCAPGDGVLVLGYGSGAGADALLVEAGPAVAAAASWGLTQLDQGEAIDYTVYAKLRNRPL